jgi:hypothetical protein
MIILIQHAFATAADLVRFTVSVWSDARAMQREAEDKYGLMGF